MKWVDTTSYAPKDKKPEPMSFAANIGPYLRVIVFRDKGSWHMNLHPFFSDKPLDLPDVAEPEIAQERAQWLVGEIAHEIERHLR